MKVLSLFDGISCARVALERAGIPVEAYYASEIETYSIDITRRNYPDTKHLGDVCGIRGHLLKDIDLLIGGSPCQDLSGAKVDGKGLEGDRSGLFYEYVRILREAKPKWFVLENVASMKNVYRDAISKELGVEPIMINASLVSAQDRKRYFWTNIPGITQPEDRHIYLKDVLEKGYAKDPKARTITASYRKGAYAANIGTHRERTMVFDKPIQIGIVEGTKGGQACRIYSVEGKSVTLKALGGGSGGKTGLYAVPLDGTDPIELQVRDLTPVECERLQSLPDGYTAGPPKTRRIETLGNAFNVEVIAHILKHIP